MKRNCWKTGLVCLLLAGSALADAVTSTLNFADLNTALSGNTLNVNGSTDNLTVLGAVDDNDYLYSVTYTGADFDGDSVNDTLSFDVLVEGLSGTVVDGTTLGDVADNSVTDASATIGSTDTDVTLTTGESVTTWVVGEDRFSSGETLKFSIVNVSCSAGSVSIDGFSSVLGQEWYTHSHQAIIGEGIDSLNGYDFNGNLTMTVSPAESPLYVSAANDDSNFSCWGVGAVDFGLTISVEIERTVVEWDGSVDSNWNIAGNWMSGGVPGTDLLELAVLSGSNDDPVVATPVETTNSCAIEIYDEALLEVCRGDLLCDYIHLGSEDGLGGGTLKLWSSADVAVSGDLRVGDDPGSTSHSTLELIKGALSVGGELYVGNGLLEVCGDDCSIAVDDLTVSSDATLTFDFDIYPVSTVQVVDALTIESGAKLEIDLRDYTMGGNELELITFSSVSGSFDPSDITITGLAGGVVTMDEDSLNLTVIDDVADRSCTLWFVATAGDGSEYTDLQVNTGRRIRNLSSPDMSYASASDGDAMVHSVTWDGSDFDGDGANDTVSFDLRVEGFSGSSYVYDDSDANGTVIASMTALGSAAVVSGDSSGWGVGTDMDLDAGETVRFSMENLQLSTAGGFAEGFVGVQLAEVSGFGHILILGEGEDLQSQESNYSISMGFAPEEQLLVTSATDSGVRANQVALKMIVSDLPDVWDTETGDYSRYPTGPTHREEYAAVTNINYPPWSWDTLQMEAGVGRNFTLSDEVAEIIATTYPVVNLGGRTVYGEDYIEAGMSAAAATLKQFNSDIFVMTYKNAGIHFDRTEANADFDEENWASYSLDEDGNRVYATNRVWLTYNHDYPEMRAWWSDWCVERLEDPNIDVIFIDKATGGEEELLNDEGEIEAGSNRVKSYVSIWERQPEDTILSGNVLRTSRFGGYRELLHIYGGSYLEGWESGNDSCLVAMTRTDGLCASMQLIREARVKGRMVGPNYASEYRFDLSGDACQAMIDGGRSNEVVDAIREAIQVPLAYHLMLLEPYSYFNFQVVSSEGDEGQYSEVLWNTKPYIEEFRNPLGEPLGPPVQDGYIFTRSFEHVDVWMNVEENPAEVQLTWDWMPIADAQSVTVDEDQSIAITLTGSEPQGSNFTYAVFLDPTNGTLSGTAPNLVYTPDPDFCGTDRFSFQTENDTAKSLKATVLISVDPVDDPPVADDLSLMTTTDTPLAITLTGSDAEGSNLTYRVVSLPTNGVLSGTAPDLIYTSVSLCTDSFTFEVNDGSFTSSVATVSIEVTDAVYLDRFDNDGLAVNAGGVGGGAARTILNAGGDWQDDGNATFSSGTSFADAALLYSSNSFQSAGGFELTVNYTCSSVETTGRNLFGFGLLESATNLSVNSSPFGELSSVYSLGVNLITESGINVGLNFADGATLIALDSNAIGAGTDRVVVIRVEADGLGGADWSYSVAGVDKASGYLDSFDFSRSFHFAAYGQDNEQTKVINSVELQLLDEPGGYASWAAGYGLSGDDSVSTADVENGGVGDGFNNLVEYALGMNPTNSESSLPLSASAVVELGTNWFQIIHDRRSDYLEEGLSYLLIDSTNLVGSVTSTNTQDQILVGPAVDSYQSVTNRYEAGDKVKFIKLEINQN